MTVGVGWDGDGCMGEQDSTVIYMSEGKMDCISMCVGVWGGGGEGCMDEQDYCHLGE